MLFRDASAFLSQSTFPPLFPYPSEKNIVLKKEKFPQYRSGILKDFVVDAFDLKKFYVLSTLIPILTRRQSKLSGIWMLNTVPHSLLPP